MQFNIIKNIILFGGSRILAELALDIIATGKYDVTVYTNERQLTDKIYEDGLSLRDFLTSHSIEYISTEDINSEPSIVAKIDEATLGIGLGEPWSFSKELIALFDGRLLDLMGIRLPQYRGGAHYTWQILRGNRIGCCNLQIINEEMVQGVFDSGEIVKSREYFFPPGARVPDDYFTCAVEQEISFIKEFLKELSQGVDFPLTKLQESFSVYFPRLNTKKQALIDWSWDTTDIEKFICAFDSPYPGASTFVNKQRVYLKNCFIESNDGDFHPFQVGLIYKIYNRSVFIATRSGTLIVSSVMNEDDVEIIGSLRVGQRFYTPGKYLDDAMLFHAEYE